MAHLKKVLWLIKGLGAGGAEKLLSTAIPYLDQKTFQYEVAYLLPQKDDLVPEFEQAGIPVHCVGTGSPYDPMMSFRLMKLLKERQVDVIHMHLPHAGILGRIAARLAGVKAVVYTEHNVLDVYHPLTALADRFTYPLDHMTVAVSEAVRVSTLRWKVFKPRHVVTIYNGVQLGGRTSGNDTGRIRESLGIPPADYVVGNVAHIRPEKGHRFLIDAARLVIEECPDTTFVIVGREKAPGAVQELLDQAGRLGIRDRVIFTGFREDATDLMTAFDVFVLSSLFEGLPVALLEAMARGKPVVVTAVGGIPEVVTHGVDGLIVPPRDHRQLAQTLVALLKDPELRQRMSANAATKVHRRFNVESMVGALEAVYTQVLNRDGARDVMPASRHNSRGG